MVLAYLPLPYLNENIRLVALGGYPSDLVELRRI